MTSQAVQNILDQITPTMSVDDIRALVNTWDMNLGTDTLVLYSGGVGDVQPDGRLGLGVTDNDTWQGQIANDFTEADEKITFI